MYSPASAATPLARPQSIAEFDEALDRLLIDVAAGAAARDKRAGALLRDEVAALQQLGFGAFRLPVEQGGLGGTLEQLFERVIRIATADPSLAHVYRGHIALVEQLLAGFVPVEGYAEQWFARLAAGELIGIAWAEKHASSDLTARIERDADDVASFTGRKHYSTGSIYSDWVSVSAFDGERRVNFTVPSDDPAVTILDNWDGFGQAHTGTGSTVFDRVEIAPGDIVPFGDNTADVEYLAVTCQLGLLAVVAGIGQAILRDTVEFVRPRTRTFAQLGTTSPREDPLVQQIVGSISAKADAARRLVLSVVRDIEPALDRYRAGDEQALGDLELDTYRIQQLVAPLVLEAADELFEVGGASAVSRETAYDRHWRNARTVHSHNPAILRRRTIGNAELNGARPYSPHTPVATETSTP